MADLLTEALFDEYCPQWLDAFTTMAREATGIGGVFVRGERIEDRRYDGRRHDEAFQLAVYDFLKVEKAWAVFGMPLPIDSNPRLGELLAAVRAIKEDGVVGLYSAAIRCYRAYAPSPPAPDTPAAGTSDETPS